MNEKYRIYVYGGLIILGISLLLVIAVVIKGKPKQPELTVDTITGPVTVDDFTKTPVEQVADTVIVARAAEFEIAYFEKEQTFTVLLLTTPLSSARLAAETALLEKLGVSKEEACRLKVSVMTIQSVDEQLAGKEFGLSFCSGAATIP